MPRPIPPPKTISTPLGELPLTLDAPQTARYFGCSTDCLYDQVRAGTCPVMPLRLGRRLRWPTRQVLAAVGIDTSDANEDGPTAA